MTFINITFGGSQILINTSKISFLKEAENGSCYIFLTGEFKGIYCNCSLADLIAFLQSKMSVSVIDTVELTKMNK